MKKLIHSVVEALKTGRELVVVSVIASSGSTPRGAGATMLVHKDGSSEGTIGGGAIEYEAQKQARGIFNEKNSRTESYRLAPNDVADLGMICGGNVTVYYQYLEPGSSGTLELFTYLSEAFDRDGSTWIIRRLQDGAMTGMGAYDKQGLHFLDSITPEALGPFLTGKAEMLQGEPAYYVEPLVLEGRVYIFGGGHVAQELVPVLSHVGFSTVVFEDRENFADKALFQGVAQVVLGDFTRISDFIAIEPADYVVIMTRGHQADYEVLEQALRTQATYIGCIGSRRKMELTKKRLIEAGIMEAGINRLHSPIGIEIEAETPAEIAISVAGELILHRARDRG